MALRYTTGFDNYEIEIDDANYTGDPSELLLSDQPIRWEYQGDEGDTYPTVIPSYLTIGLIATESFELNHIYTDNERALRVTLRGAGNLLGQYFVIPDGTSESFVDPPYNVSVRCVDGLGLMKNFPYQIPAAKASILKTIAACLANTGLGLNINTYSTLIYDGMGGNDVYANTIITQERFASMNCEEVLHQLLKEWVSGIVQVDGEWYLFRWPDLVRSTGPVLFRRYDAAGEFVGTNGRTLPRQLSATGTDLIHVEPAPTRSVNMPYKAVSIRYEYGFIENLLPWETRYLFGFLDFNGWTRQNGVNAVPNSSTGYAVIHGKNVSEVNSENIRLTTPVDVVGGQKITLEITFNVGKANSLPFTIGYWVPGGPTFFYGPGETWTNTPGYRFFDNYVRDDGGTYGKGETIKGEVTFTVPGLPDEAAFLSILIAKAYYHSDNNYAATTPGEARIYEVNLLPSPGQKSIISETHTVVNNGAYTNRPDAIEVSTGESLYKDYLGTMFKADGVTPTQGFRRDLGEPVLPFLTMAAEDILYQHGRPMTRYEGNISGFFPILSRITIAHLPGVYMPVRLNYDLLRGTVEATLNEVNADPVPHTVEDIEYEYEDTKQTGVSDGQ